MSTTTTTTTTITTNNNSNKEEDKRLEYLKGIKDDDWFWHPIYWSRNKGRKLNYMPLHFRGNTVILDNNDLLNIINDDEKFQEVANPIKISLNQNNLSSFVSFLYETNFTGPCTFIIVRHSYPTKYSYAVSNVIDPLEPGSKHDYLTNYVKEKYIESEENKNPTFDIIAGELNILQGNIEMNFISSATMTQIKRQNIYSDLNVIPKTKGDIYGERKAEWDYFWDICALFLERLKAINLQTNNITLPRERRGKSFTFIESDNSNRALKKWSNIGVKLYISTGENDEEFEDRVQDINLRDFQHGDTIYLYKEGDELSIQRMKQLKLIEDYDIKVSKRKRLNSSTGITKKMRRWNVRLNLILGEFELKELQVKQQFLKF